MRIRLKHRRLARRIAASSMTQNRWAQRLGLSSGQLSELINGKRPYPPAETRRKLLQGLQLDFDELFELVREPDAANQQRRTLLRWAAGRYRLKVEQVVRQGGFGKRKVPMSNLFYELGFAWRSLRRAPLFTAAVALTLALGIGVNAAVFSVVDATLFKALPYPDPGRLYFLSIGVDRITGAPLAMSDVEAIEETASSALAGLALYLPGSATLTQGELPQRLRAARVSSEFFRVLGIQPALGRDFLPTESDGGTHPDQVLLSHSLWSRLGADSSLPGQAVSLDGVPTEVIGVLPRDFHYPGLPGVECWKLLPETPSKARGPFSYRVLVRLAEGSSLDEAAGRLEVAKRVVSERFGEEPGSSRYELTDLQERFVGHSRAMLMMLLAAVAVVLCIATVNVANLAMTRASNRSREIAVRSVLGAGRGRLVGHFLAEGLMLALLGGALGCLLASWIIQLLVTSHAGRFSVVNAIVLDWRTLLFAGVASLLCGVLFSILPACKLLNEGLFQRIRSSSRATVGPRESRLGSWLVGAEFALALMLLVGAGLLAKSLIQLTAQDPGFESEGVVTMDIFLPDSRYPRGADRSLFYDDLMRELRALPAVSAAGLASGLPPDRPSMTTDFVIEGREPGPGERPPIEFAILCDEQYFAAAGIPLLRGRLLVEARERLDQVVVDETFARKHFPDGRALGRRIRVGSNASQPWMEIVGVVSAVKYAGLAADFRPVYYLPYGYFPVQRMHLVVRSRLDAGDLASQIRRVVGSRDAALAPSRVQTMGSLLSQSTSSHRFRSQLIGSFAALSLILSVVGIYAVVSSGVNRRLRETGIRMALGAGRGEVVRLILASGLRPALVGLIVGSILAIPLTRFLSGFLYGVSPLDPSVFGLAAAAVLAASAAACLNPARRAARVDPAQCLRCD